MKNEKSGYLIGRGLSPLPEQFIVACGGISRWAVKNTVMEMQNLKKYQYAVASAFAGGTPTVAQKEKCAMRFLPGLPAKNEELLRKLKLEPNGMLKNLSLNEARGFPLPITEIAFPEEQGWLRISHGQKNSRFYGTYDTRLTFNLARPLPQDFPDYEEVFNRPDFKSMECIDREARIGIGHFTISTPCESGDRISEYIFESLTSIRKHTEAKRTAEPLVPAIRTIMAQVVPAMCR